MEHCGPSSHRVVEAMLKRKAASASAALASTETSQPSSGEERASLHGVAPSANLGFREDEPAAKRLRVEEGSSSVVPEGQVPKEVTVDTKFRHSRKRMFYGPGGPYALFAGREASRALALMSFDHNDLNGNLAGLCASELEVLQDWDEKFMEKYVWVGRLVSENATNTNNSQNNDKVEAQQEPRPGTENQVENTEIKGNDACINDQ